ncbi:MAG TPA: response regulator, partial [Polyangia bacterium]|nr:response regulator [Polyangia bacterium]
MSARRLLLVDDDETFRVRLARALVARGLAVETAADPAAALAAARRATPDCAVVDLKMPGGSGLELVRELAALVPGIRVVVLTG